MKKIMFFAVGVLLLFSFTNVSAQKEKFQSLFIYNFSKYVKWPDGLPTDKFVIGVIGSTEMTKALESMATNRKVNGTDIIVKQFSSASEVEDCHILYISESASSKLSSIVSDIGDKPVLIVSDTPGMAKKGSVINFIEEEGKIKFELNQKYAESRGLKVSGSLVSLAILV
jgi:hypothetical protein